MSATEKESHEVTIHAMQMTAWNGALPPPDMARAYEELHKGALERLLSIAEEEARCRRVLTERDHDAYNRSVNKGMNCAFVLTLCAFIGGVVCACIGQTAAAIAFVGATIVNLATVFIGRKQSDAGKSVR